MCDKRELREKMKALRVALKDEEKDKLLSLRAAEELKNFESVFLYLSFKSEAGTETLIYELLKQGKILCAPKVKGKEMFSVPLKNVKKGAFGILEPEEGEEIICPIAITPLLAADEEGYRLGYGGGYYDRYFARHPEVIRAGYAYEGQRVSFLPRETFDLPLDVLFTERGVYPFSDRWKR